MKRIIALLVFTFLMLVKVSALHVYVHQNDDCNTIENCEICDIALESQSSDLEIPSQFIGSNYNNILEIKCFTEKAQAFSRDSIVYQLFSRPPPSL